MSAQNEIHPVKKPSDNGAFSPERITNLTLQLSSNMDKAIKDIQRITFQSRILSLNAKVEAARAGGIGSAFSVVATEMGSLSHEIENLVENLENKSSKDFKEIAKINDHIAIDYRGLRLSDLALTNIDLIDRNLYERSCDVRWWATDNSFVDALTKNTQDAYDFASKRMGIILDAYTVYFDLVLCNLEGTIVANGKRELYDSVGKDASVTKWFNASLKCATGDDFGWETVHRSPLVNGELVLLYSAAIRKNGDKYGKILGVLGIIFKYAALAQTIVENTSLSKEENLKSRICIVDGKGLVLADSDKKNLEDIIDFRGKHELFENKKGFIIAEYKNSNCCIAHAKAPGYETYTTGWHSLIIQKI
ncbi:MAG: methyl-accepting chemotaxis protein [Candidatus Brocadiaceae bacterium]|nr:methyl-accepting chemotaxis protein [Candidatus Brocadiaceae bacterium]